MMADNKEQRVCMKFCFLLGKSAAETVLMLQEAFKEEALRFKCMGRIHVSKGVKCYVRTSLDLADLQPAEMVKILKKFATQSMQIVVEPLMRFRR
jgi:hypothetical protein